MFTNQEHALITKQLQNCHNQPPYEGDKKVISTFLSECENFPFLLLTQILWINNTQGNHKHMF
jgi:hypothetical protein